MTPNRFLIVALAAAVLVSGCASDLMKKVEKQVADDNRAVAQAAQRGRETITMPPVISTQPGFYVNKTPLIGRRDSVDDQPARLKETITISRRGASSLLDITGRITEEMKILVAFTPDVWPGNQASSTGATPPGGATPLPGQALTGSTLSPVAQRPWANNFQYSGPLTGLLDVIASRENLSWRWTGERVEFRRFITKVFAVHSMAGTSELTARVQGATAGGGTPTGGSPGGGSSGSTTASGQTTQIQYRVSFWEGIKESVRAMVSDSGRYYVSEQTSSVTVTDTPAVVGQVEEYVKDLNRRLTRKVMIVANVYSVQLSDRDQRGVNWNVVWRTLTGKYRLALSTPALSSTLGQFSMTVNDPTGSSPWNTSQAILGALSEIGNTSLVNSVNTTTLSGNAVPLQNVLEQAFVQSITANAVPNAGTSTSIQQGTITTGFSVNIVPLVIDDGEILLQTALDLSTLEGLATFTSGGNTVQQPTKALKNFLNRTSITSGQTLILAGLEQNSLFDRRSGTIAPDPLTGGSRTGDATRSVLVIVISARLVL
jgi:type IVB pilus formation R64 PilN family outer membrane protein